jgi:hypothetical protein
MNRMQKQQLYFAGVLALALLLVLTGPALAKDVTGTIVNIEPDNHTFDLVTDEGNVLSFRALVTADVLLNDEAKTIWDLQIGDQASIAYAVEEEEMLATIIRCTRE